MPARPKQNTATLGCEYLNPVASIWGLSLLDTFLSCLISIGNKGKIDPLSNINHTKIGLQ